MRKKKLATGMLLLSLVIPESRSMAALIAADDGSKYNSSQNTTGINWANGSNGGTGYPSTGWTIFQTAGAATIASSTLGTSSFRLNGTAGNYNGAQRQFPTANIVGGKGLDVGQTFTIDMDLSGSAGGTSAGIDGSGFTISGNSTLFRVMVPTGSSDYAYTTFPSGTGIAHTGISKNVPVTVAFTFVNRATGAFKLDFTLVGGSTTSFTGGTGTTNDNLLKFQLDGYGANNYFNNMQVSSPAPEPACLGLILIGCAGGLLRRRRRVV